ncbi:MAG: DinB family protein [Pedobacter sp.]|uniref:DinB family protein n=1 Tax=Pedobacter sp. TaxID=1411316 RepID=UPI00280A3B06|nr:DinB family protein [Pedobacter sp.]MDQ8006700.1 DinB family protein [Pedobacter sp.]
MGTIDKKAFIANLYQRTEVILEKAVQQYQNLDELSLNFSTNSDTWSIAQVLSHLNSYGNYYLPKMEAVLQQPHELSLTAYTPSWLGTYFVNMMDANRSSKRYKAAKQHQPLVSDAYAEVAQFINQQERMLKCLKAFETVDVSRTRIRISIAKFIKLNLGDLLSFLVMHNERHMVQIKRIQREQTEALSQRTVLATLAS